MTGADRPRRFLLPGLDGTGRLYAPLVAALADAADVSVLAYEQREFLDYPALVEALAPALPDDGNTWLVTESFAGPLGVLLAHRHPGRVRGLVMAASFVHAPLPASRLAAQMLQRLPAIQPPLSMLEHVLAGGGLPAPLRVEFQAVMAELPLEVLRQRALAALRVDVRRELAALHMPLLYLQARHDRLIRRRAGYLIGQVARDARRAVIDAPHFLFQMAPAPAAAAILCFIDEILHGPVDQRIA